MRYFFFGSLLLLTGCSTIGQPETAQHALRVFCTLHRADILNTLLTADQQQAGATVCAAVGMGLGT